MGTIRSPDPRNAEGTLWALTGVYSGFARGDNHFNENPGKYFKNDIWEPMFILYLREQINLPVISKLIL